MWKLWILLSLLFAQSDLPYAQPGPYAAGTMEFSIEDPERPLTVTVWYPSTAREGNKAIYRLDILSVAGNALRDVAPANDGAPYPLLIFSHGSNGMRMQSLYFTEHLATYGFIVIAADHPGNTIIDFLKPTEFGREIGNSYLDRPHDIQRLVDFAGTLTAEGGALEGLIDLDHVAVSGHSFGGYTAFASSGGLRSVDALKAWCDAPTGIGLPEEGENTFTPLDNYGESGDFACFLLDVFAALDISGEFEPVNIEPDAVLAFAPWNAPVFSDLSGVTAPTLTIVGSADHVTLPERDAYAYYSNTGSEWKALAVLNGADHYIFVDECAPSWRMLGFDDVCSDPVWEMAEGHAIINHLSTAFLLWTLKGDAEAGAVLENVAIEDVRYFKP